MKRLLHIFTYFIFFIYTSLAAAVLPDQSHPQFHRSLNGEWKFKYCERENPEITSTFFMPDYSDKNWPLIRVPGHWELYGYEEPSFGMSSPSVGYYRKEFEIPRNWKDRRVFLQVDGAMDGIQLWVDGETIGMLDSPVIPTPFDITDVLSNTKKHILAARVYKPNHTQTKTWAFSGIHRSVSLLSVPDIYINDLVFHTEREEKTGSTRLNCSVELAAVGIGAPTDGITLKAELYDPDANPAGTIVVNYLKSEGNRLHANFLVPVSDPKLWSAENPVLYSLNITLMMNDEPIQQYERPAGLRWIDIQRGELRLNGTPIKLRGVCYQGFDPDVGFAMREPQWKRDLQLMQEANINAVWYLNSPPSPGFLDLCEQLGIYAVCSLPCETPEQIDTTLRSMRNHAAAIVWSVGNETMSVENAMQSVEYVKRADPTRPILLPGKAERNLPKAIDILAPLFPSIEEWSRFGRMGRPVIALKYADALEDTFEGLGLLWETARQNRTLAGGMIWRFADQGLRRNQTIDSQEEKGTDGIVNADRAPQTDYWQSKQIYSPIQILENEQTIIPGLNTIEITIHNHYNFKNLRDISIEWFLMEDHSIIDRGNMLLDLEPGKKMEMAVTVTLPEDIEWHEYMLRLHFVDSQQRSLYEHVVRLKPPKWEESFLTRLDDLRMDKDWSIQINQQKVQIDHRNYQLRIDPHTGEWFLMTPKRHVRLITGGPYIRLGREPGWADRIHYQEEGRSLLPDPYLLKKLRIDSFHSEKIENHVEIEMELTNETYSSIQAASNESDPDLECRANVDLFISPFGYCDVRYTLEPQNRDGYFLETGLSFLAPPLLDRISWLGNGPFPAYPGKQRLSQRGLFQWILSDRFLQGNRSGIDLLALTDERGNGIGLMMFGGNISLERLEEGVLVSVNSSVAGLGSQYHQTLFPLEAKRLKERELTAAFRLIPFSRNQHPQIFNSILK